MNILIKINIFLYASLNFEKESEKGEARGQDWGSIIYKFNDMYQYTAHRELFYKGVIMH